MKILGNRVLVSAVEKEPKKEGEFQTVEVMDEFVYKGKIEKIGEQLAWTIHELTPHEIREGAIILFAKGSPDTHEVDVEGKKMKVVKVEDILAIL